MKHLGDGVWRTPAAEPEEGFDSHHPSQHWYWDLDGGTGDRHRILLDDRGQLWGWENVTPRDPKALKAALLNSVTRWHHYAVSAVIHTDST